MKGKIAMKAKVFGAIAGGAIAGLIIASVVVSAVNRRAPAENFEANTDTENPLPAKQSPPRKTVSVSFESAYLNFLVGRDRFGNMLTGHEPELFVILRIDNFSPTLKVNYSRWRGLTLADELGNSYGADDPKSSESFYFVHNGKRYDTYDTHAIQPAQTIWDAFLFEKPVAPAKVLHLHLPLRNIGDTGWALLDIPADKISPREPPMAPPEIQPMPVPLPFPPASGGVPHKPSPPAKPPGTRPGRNPPPGRPG